MHTPPPCRFALLFDACVSSCPTFHHPTERVSGQPLDLRVKAVKTNSITISWKVGDPVMEGLISEFKIWICKSGELNFTAGPNCSFKSSERRAIAHNLDEGTEYVFKLLAFINDKVVGVGEVKGSTPEHRSAAAAQDILEDQRYVLATALEDHVSKLSSHHQEPPRPQKDEVQPVAHDMGGQAGCVLNRSRPDGETISVEEDLKDHDTTSRAVSPPHSEGEQVGFGSCHGASSVTHSSGGQVPTETPPVSSRQDEDHKPEVNDLDRGQEHVRHVKDDDEAASASEEGGEQALTDTEEAPSADICVPEEKDIEMKVENSSLQAEGHPHMMDIVKAEGDQTCSAAAVPPEDGDIAGGGCGETNKDTFLAVLPPNYVDQKPEVKLEYVFPDRESNGVSSGADKAAVWKEEPVKYIEQENTLGVGKQTFLETEGLVSSGHSFGRCVKVVRMLEKQGHLPSEFRKAFLTWFSRRATAADKEEVNVFIDTLGDDAEQLAGQFLDTYEEVITSKKPRFDSSTQVGTG